MYNQFGLGVKTGIDLPFEGIGYIGNDTYTPSLIDFPIGQYDTYTPLQILQYINTVASSGERNALHYLKEVKDDNKIIYSYDKKTLNKVNVKPENMNRVRQGLKMVMEGGTGSGYVNSKYNVSGKTGTAESFLDTDLDGKIDTATITKTFGAYIVNENESFSMVVISPHVSTADIDYISGVNKKISRSVSDIYFKKYN
jgi:cell division protein FtsI/penicillin-binding protein 2